MTRSKNVNKAVGQTPRFVAITNFSDAGEYHAAAKLLYASQQTKLDSPQYLLISLTIELYLKAFIVICSGSVEEVLGAGIQHNLRGLLSKAEKLGFVDCDQHFREVLVKLHPLHMSHYFRYRTTSHDPWPTVRESLSALGHFAKCISPLIAKKINER